MVLLKQSICTSKIYHIDVVVNIFFNKFNTNSNTHFGFIYFYVIADLTNQWGESSKLATTYSGFDLRI
jgi:hypothetical protein